MTSATAVIQSFMPSTSFLAVASRSFSVATAIAAVLTAVN